MAPDPSRAHSATSCAPCHRPPRPPPCGGRSPTDPPSVPATAAPSCANRYLTEAATATTAAACVAARREARLAGCQRRLERERERGRALRPTPSFGGSETGFRQQGTGRIRFGRFLLGESLQAQIGRQTYALSHHLGFYVPNPKSQSPQKKKHQTVLENVGNSIYV